MCLSNDNTQYGISTQRSITESWKGVMHRDKLQNRWTLKTPRTMKEASHKRPYIVWTHLYEATRIGKSTERHQWSGCQGLAAGEVKSEGSMLRGLPSWGEDSVWSQTVVTVAQHGECTRCHSGCISCCVSFTTYEKGCRLLLFSSVTGPPAPPSPHCLRQN